MTQENCSEDNKTKNSTEGKALEFCKEKTESGMSSNMLAPYEFFRAVLKSPKYIVAPMVEQSELAWRILSRRHGAHLCFTPMIHAKIFTEDARYRKEALTTIPEDRPLIIQFCANDPEILLKAGKLVEDKCDAIDLNLGCPQDIARRGRYGSYLQDEWKLISKMVSTCKNNLKVPITVKIRIFPEVSKTLDYAKMIEEAGASMLTVHGRVREQKGHNTGLADWNQIKAVKEALKIPVIANGNILYHEDIHSCLKISGVDGVMSAEGNLYNPYLFEEHAHPHIYTVVEEYLNICHELKSKGLLNEWSPIRAHLFKLYKPALHIHTDLRDKLAKVNSLEGFKELAQVFKQRLLEDEEKSNGIHHSSLASSHIENPSASIFKVIPHWQCQPYIRPPNIHNKRKGQNNDDHHCLDESSKKSKEIQYDDSQAKISQPLDNQSQEISCISN